MFEHNDCRSGECSGMLKDNIVNEIRLTVYIFPKVALYAHHHIDNQVSFFYKFTLNNDSSASCGLFNKQTIVATSRPSLFYFSGAESKD